MTEARNGEDEDPCVHRRVAAQAHRTPFTVAVEFEGRRLTYGELDRLARRLAARLAALGVGRGAVVGLALERGPDVAVALLATLHAGAAYLPLDPAYPTDRLRLMLGDARARVLLTERHLLARLGGFSGEVVLLDGDRGEDSPADPADPVRASLGADDLAYVMYTSGSTGRPKGVAMTHGVLGNLISWQVRQSRLGEGARTLQFAPLSFDVSFQEMMATWCAGGTLVMIPEELRTDLVALGRFLAEAGIERLFLPFVALHHLAEALAASPGLPLRLSEVVTAGEQLRITAPIARLLARLPAGTIHNHYGPSETHVCTAFTLSGPPGDWPPLPPIGRPLAGTTVALLDDRLRPVPAGAPGELFVSGACVARGYLGRPDLTAERFLPAPEGEPGGRMYRTGDLARLRPDGELEFLGRADRQVKIRGHRVEPGEVEAALGTHPAVGDCAVLAIAAGTGKKLVAYLAGAERPGAGAAELRSFLARTLPVPMLPAEFHRVDAFPLTPSGKVDRAALAALSPAAERIPEPEPRARGVEAGPAPTPVEAMLGRIWRAVLEVDAVGVHDDFFALGGHSLTATQVSMRVARALGVELPVAAMFDAPTVARQARYLLATEVVPGRAEAIARLVQRVERMTDAEVRAGLAERRRAAPGTSERPAAKPSP